MEKIKTMLYSHHQFIDARGEPENNDPRYIEYRKQWKNLPLTKKVSEFPLHLDIENTNVCNLKCPMCLRYVMRDKEGFMDFKLYKKIIDEGKAYGLPSINYSLRGEPLLHPRFFDMVKYAKKQGVIDIRINTNGVLLNDDMIRKLIESKIDKLIFSVDGATKETYESIRIGSNFNTVTSNIKKLVRIRDSMGKEKPDIDIRIVDMMQTRKEIQQFIDIWKPIANRICIVMYRNPVGKVHDKFRVESAYTQVFPCPQLWQRLIIGWNGKIFICCGDNKGLVILGDANKDSLHDIWHSAKLNNIRELHKNYESDKIPPCKICEFNKYVKTKKQWGV